MPPQEAGWRKKLMQTLVLIPVDDSVVFPNMSVTRQLAVDVGDEERVVLVPRKGDEFARRAWARSSMSASGSSCRAARAPRC